MMEINSDMILKACTKSPETVRGHSANESSAHQGMKFVWNLKQFTISSDCHQGD